MLRTVILSPVFRAGCFLRARDFSALTLLAVLLLVCSAASASTITGDPATDGGWTYQGNSLFDGTYIRGGGNTDFNLYTSSFTVAAGSSLLTNGSLGWQAGDTVVAMGGVITTTDGVTAGWGAPFVGDPVNADLTTSERIVAKFGNSPTAWSASTIAPSTGTSPYGNGNGATSGGDGGSGAILLGTLTGDLTVAHAGALQAYGASDTSQIYLSTDAYVGDNISKLIGQYIYTVDPTSHIITGWEVFLDTTKLAALSLGPSVPAAGDRVDQALQRSTNATQFTDALGTVIATPEPATWILALLAGVSGFAIRFRRRKRD